MTRQGGCVYYRGDSGYPGVARSKYIHRCSLACAGARGSTRHNGDKWLYLVRYRKPATASGCQGVGRLSLGLFSLLNYRILSLFTAVCQIQPAIVPVKAIALEKDKQTVYTDVLNCRQFVDYSLLDTTMGNGRPCW
jgi:hypothetical protein